MAMDKEREAIKEYLAARGWVEGPDGWWRRPECADRLLWDAYRLQCQTDAEMIVAALRETGRL